MTVREVADAIHECRRRGIVAKRINGQCNALRGVRVWDGSRWQYSYIQSVFDAIMDRLPDAPHEDMARAYERVKLP